MGRSTKWLALVSITALVLVSLLGGIVSALAENGEVSAEERPAVISEGTEGDATGPEEEGAAEEDAAAPAPPEGFSAGDNALVAESEGEEQQAPAPEGEPEAGTLCLLSKICVVKFLDENGNGKMDAGEVGMAGVTITLNGKNPKETGSDGKVCYDGLNPGQYTVSETVPPGYHATTPTSYTVDICWFQKVTVFFGNAPDVVLKGSISGHKWLDPNGDGSFEDKTPLGGVTIELWKDGAKVDSKVTAADGSYFFGNLEPGDYTIKEVVPLDMEAITPISVDVSVAEGQDVTGIDFYNKKKVCDDGVIEAVVRVDENCDGVFTWDDPLLDGVTFRLYHVEEGGGLTPVVPPSLLSGEGWGWEVIFFVIKLPVYYSGGHVIWEGLPRAYNSDVEATYRLVMEVPEGYTALSPTEYDLTLHNCPWPCWWFRKEFLLGRTFHINGYKYEDVNCNGMVDAADTGVPGIEIELFIFDEDSGEYEYLASTLTDADGYYEFTGLKDGVYKVQEILTPELLEDWFVVSPEGGVFEGLEVGCGDSFDNLNFLNARYLSISGAKWDGCTEDPVPGIVIELWKDGAKIAEDITDENGEYSFDGLKPGTYTVREALTGDQLEDWFIVSPEGGIYEDVALACGQPIEGLDFVNARYGAVEGWKYWDKDENGIMDGDDEGLPGITIILTPEEGEPQTTVTDANGYFFFGKLKPGTYDVSVDESTAVGYYPVGPTSIEVDVLCGQTVKVYFSEAPYASISGKKWLDANFNGIWDESETVVIEGVTIRLYAGDPPSELIATTATDSDGYYEFTDLLPGVYTVVEMDMEGYFSSTPQSVGVELSAGEGAVVDFGNCPYGRIEGLKFIDLDGDGARDPGEPTREGVVVTLTDTGGGFVAVTTTGEDGTFVFNKLMPGQYTVTETVPSGYYATFATAVPVVVNPGDSVSVIFGNAPYGSIVGNKWLDTGNSVIDDSDLPGPGITITLTGKTAGGELVNQETVTVEDGSYSFLLLEAGSYTVTEIFDPEKMLSITDESVDVELAPGQEKRADFLNAEFEVQPQPPIRPDETAPTTLPRTGMDQLPLLIAAAILVLLGIVFLASGLRRRYQE